MSENDGRKRNEGRGFSTLSSLAAAFFSVIAIGVVTVSYIRGHGETFAPADRGEASPRDAAEWLDAVESGCEGAALAIAERIYPSKPPEMPDSDCIILCEKLRISTAPFTAPYNHLDFLRWRDALAARKKAVEFASAGNATPKTLCEKVFDNFDIVDGKSDNSATTVTGIMAKRKISLGEAARLLSALAEQSAYRPWVVMMFDAKRAPARLLCEIRGKNGAACVADPLSKKIWAGKSAEDFERNPALLLEVAPNLAGRGPFRAFRLLPAEVMDYKPAEQKLAEKLTELTRGNRGAATPVFGKSPRARIDAFVAGRKKGAPPPLVSYWHFPFKSLKSSPEFPQEWKLPEKSSRKRSNR